MTTENLRTWRPIGMDGRGETLAQAAARFAHWEEADRRARRGARFGPVTDERWSLGRGPTVRELRETFEALGWDAPLRIPQVSEWDDPVAGAVLGSEGDGRRGEALRREREAAQRERERQERAERVAVVAAYEARVAERKARAMADRERLYQEASHWEAIGAEERHRRPPRLPARVGPCGGCGRPLHLDVPGRCLTCGWSWD